MNAIITAAFAVLFSVTGFFLWYGERNTRFRFAQTILVHDWLMYVSFFLFLGHLYLAVIHPKTRHALNGMTRGWVDRDWAQQHHAKWVASLDAAAEGARESPLATLGRAADDLEAPRLARGEERVGVDLVGPAEEVALRLASVDP